MWPSTQKVCQWLVCLCTCVEGKSGDKKANGVDSSDEPEVKRQRIAVDGLEDDDDQATPTPLFMDEPLRGPPLAPVAHAPIDDSHMRLKYTYGINAWKQWVTAKNAELETAAGSGRGGASRPKLFKSEILQCNADELNVALSLFVREVRKPTEQAYAADSVYYLCLGMPARCMIIILVVVRDVTKFEFYNVQTSNIRKCFDFRFGNSTNVLTALLYNAN